MLKRLPEYSEANIVRSRKEEVLGSCDIVVDVGGVYDPSKHRYDHHQRSDTKTKYRYGQNSTAYMHTHTHTHTLDVTGHSQAVCTV